MTIEVFFQFPVDETFADPRVDRVLAKVSATIDRNELRNVESDARDKFAIEWKQVSLVIDRILLLVFFLAMTTTSLVILTSSPHLYTTYIPSVVLPTPPPPPPVTPTPATADLEKE